METMKKVICSAASLLILIIFSLSYPAGAAEPQDPGLNEDTLYVRSLILTTGIVDHEPVDTVQAFSVAVDSHAFCHIRVYNTTDPTNIRFRWIKNDTSYAVTQAEVGISTGWRTYSSIRPQAGKWKVQILGPDRVVLRQKSFSILRDR